MCCLNEVKEYLAYHYGPAEAVLSEEEAKLINDRCGKWPKLSIALMIVKLRSLRSSKYRTQEEVLAGKALGARSREEIEAAFSSTRVNSIIASLKKRFGNLSEQQLMAFWFILCRNPGFTEDELIEAVSALLDKSRSESTSRKNEFAPKELIEAMVPSTEKELRDRRVATRLSKKKEGSKRDPEEAARAPVVKPDPL